MPLYCSNTGSTALREAEVQQPNTAATLSFTSSFLDFSAKVGQSLAPSSWMNSILRPSTPPMALIWSMASFSACTELVSLMAMVPVTECRMPTFTVLSVTARPVVLTAAVAGAARAPWLSISAAGNAARLCNNRRRSGEWDVLVPGNFVNMVQPLRQSIRSQTPCVLGRVLIAPGVAPIREMPHGTTSFDAYGQGREWGILRVMDVASVPLQKKSQKNGSTGQGNSL